MSTQKPMSAVAFTFMRVIMNIRGQIRNIDNEINFVGLNAGDTVVDYGCGLGFNTIPAAKAIGSNGKVFAQDISPRAIKIVNKKANKNNLSNIVTLLSDCSINLDDVSADIVYLHNVLPMIKDKEKSLKEITRVLKSGGRLSYTSGKGARVYGEDSISDERLKEILAGDYKLIKENDGHIIFEKVR